MTTIGLGMTGEVVATITHEMIEKARGSFADETTRDDFDSEEEYVTQLAIMYARELWLQMLDNHPVFDMQEMNIDWAEVI